MLPTSTTTFLASLACANSKTYLYAPVILWITQIGLGIVFFFSFAFFFWGQGGPGKTGSECDQFAL